TCSCASAMSTPSPPPALSPPAQVCTSNAPTPPTARPAGPPPIPVWGESVPRGPPLEHVWVKTCQVWGWSGLGEAAQGAQGGFLLRRVPERGRAGPQERSVAARGLQPRVEHRDDTLVAGRPDQPADALREAYRRDGHADRRETGPAARVDRRGSRGR